MNKKCKTFSDEKQKMHKDEKKVLFVHNAIPEYRIVFWNILKNYVDLKLLITNINLEDKIYNFQKDKGNLNITFWNIINKSELIKTIKQFDVIVLPPVDSVKEYFIALELLFICKIYNVECVYWTEKWEAEWNKQPFRKKIKNLIHRQMIGFIARKCEKCIASGTKSSMYLDMLNIPKRKIFIAYDSSTSPQPSMEYDIKAKYGIDNSKKLILFLGRLIPRKGCSILIEAAIPILKETNSCLLICGDGKEMEKCRNIAKNNADIIFTGIVQPKDRKKFYLQCDLFVLPSFSEKGVVEAWGLTVNEALECGTPVIATTAVGAAYDLLDEKTGIMVSENDIYSLRSAIVEVLQGKLCTNKRIIRQSYEKFSVKKMAESFGTILNRHCINITK